MVRPMVLEFQEDRTCQELDLQYMLGDTLLVAPIFREDGEVEYYLPEGTWVHLLDGRIKEGGKWYQENYDYMSLPLFVRENKILLKGASNQKPDYDYLDNITVLISEFKEDALAQIDIPNIEGKVIAKVQASREKNVITVEISEDTKWNVEKLGTQAQKIEIKGRIAKIYM